MVALLPVLSACKLIDQRTFAPAPEAETVSAAPAMEARKPLLTVQPGTQLGSYDNLLHYAVSRAEARDPAVQFDVVSVVPSRGDAADQIQAADAARAGAADVAQGADRDRDRRGAHPLGRARRSGGHGGAGAGLRAVNDSYCAAFRRIRPFLILVLMRRLGRVAIRGRHALGRGVPILGGGTPLIRLARTGNARMRGRIAGGKAVRGGAIHLLVLAPDMRVTVL